MSEIMSGRKFEIVKAFQGLYKIKCNIIISDLSSKNRKKNNRLPINYQASLILYNQKT